METRPPLHVAPEGGDRPVRPVDSADRGGTRIKVVGVGGAGGNAVDNMIGESSGGVEFITANTDRQALVATLAPTRIQIGSQLTKGLGAGANPEVGRQSAEESRQEISEQLAGADMVFITAGMGGGTGTGAAPAVAEIAADLGCLTVAVITKPFEFEGRTRQKLAEEGVRALQGAVDTLITIPNQRLLQVVGRGTSLRDAFKLADNVLRQAVEAIANLIVAPGLINLDFADVQTIMRGMGLAVMGTGVAHGNRRAVEAAQMAVSSPLLEDSSIDGARGILLNVTGGHDMALHEVHDVASVIQEAVHEDAQVIFGAVTDGRLQDELRVTVIATGFHRRDPDARDLRPASPGGQDVQGPDGSRDRRQRLQGSDGEVAPAGRRLDIPAYVRRKLS